MVALLVTTEMKNAMKRKTHNKRNESIDSPHE